MSSSSHGEKPRGGEPMRGTTCISPIGVRVFEVGEKGGGSRVGPMLVTFWH